MMLLPLALALQLAASPEEAAAQAKELFKTGQRLYKEAKYPEAIAKFEAVYELKPSPNVLYNIGKCHEQLGDVPKALRAFRDYLRRAPDAKDKDQVSDAVANLERRLKERGIQQLLIFAEPPSAAIEVDGKPAGSSPASVELTAGPHRLTLRADGYEVIERSFVMQIQRATEMTFNLQPNAAQPVPAPSAELTPRIDAPQQAETRVVAAAPTLATSSAVKPRFFTWVAGGVALAALGAGIGLSFAAQGTARTLTAATMPTTREDANRIVSMATGLNTGSTIAYVAAGTMLAVAVVLFFLEGR
jgi:tetratricopeptide (TPR) repeat protein